MSRLVMPTPGARIIVWVFPALTCYLGACFLGPRDRLTATAYTAARDIMPLTSWGLLFLTVAVLKVACLLTGSREAFILSMCAGAGLYTCWSFLFIRSIFIDPHASLVAPAWPIAWLILHMAFLSTLTRVRPV